MANVAILLAQDYEDSEFRRPFDALREAGHEVTVFGTKAGEQLRGKKGKDSVSVDEPTSAARAQAFAALVIPGGYAPDKLRLDEHAVALTRAMMQVQKPVAAICHAASLLVEADVVRGRTLTSWPSVRKDVENAGGRWVDKEVVVDGNLVTSRKPDDLDAFCEALLQQLERGAKAEG